MNPKIILGEKKDPAHLVGTGVRTFLFAAEKVMTIVTIPKSEINSQKLRPP